MKVINDKHEAMYNKIKTLREAIIKFEDEHQDHTISELMSSDYFSEFNGKGLAIEDVKEILSSYINLYNRAIDASVSPEKLQTDDIPF